HPYLTTLSDSSVAYELTRSRTIIKDTVGTTATMIRPPYGDTSLRVERIAGENGYRYMVMWSIDTGDYLSQKSIINPLL
ncbi:MAG: polysaccharide deacetylase family protein, partial [Clostridium sp.]|nr:polysaccharide deacetylase family protein [Clostridium sp.]